LTTDIYGLQKYMLLGINSADFLLANSSHMLITSQQHKSS